MSALTPAEYEEAVLQQFRILYPVPEFDVRRDIQFPGRYSKSPRQIDVMVYRRGESAPILMIEAKRHSRKVDLTRAGMTIGLVRDVGTVPAVMVSASGFSRAAERQLAAEDIGHLTITVKRAQNLRWIGPLTDQFVIDREFRELSGEMVEALRVGDVSAFWYLDCPYEEWIAIFRTGQAMFSKSTNEVLNTMTEHHVDDGCRFNAMQLLEEDGALSAARITELLSVERDPDNRELLEMLQAEAR